ncbi:MAG: DUF3843 family protein [Pseudomonadota bacterium]
MMLNKIFSLTYRLDRPEGFQGAGDKYLSKIIQEISRLIRNKQKLFEHNTFRLSASQIHNVAQMLVEFGEDLHNRIGIWETMEAYNLQFFETKLPLILEPGSDMPTEGINPLRIQYLLYVYYKLLKPELICSPHHRDLVFFAGELSRFLRDNFQTIPKDSSIKALLTSSNEYGWDVKKKLIWLGTHSYLFRQCFKNYITDQGGGKEVANIDDFLNQETTIWSGLGAIDILSEILDISAKEKSCIRSWYERHTAFYKVSGIPGSVTEFLNLINDQKYSVRIGDSFKSFDKDHIYFGSLVPYKGEWYWSGAQQRFDNVSVGDLKKLKADFLLSTRTIAYRYCKELADKARRSNKDQYEQFRKFAGDDLLAFPDGKSMAEAMQKLLQESFEIRMKAIKSVPAERKKIKVPDFSKSLPKEILKSKNGCCVYYNPDEGMEIWIEFDSLLSGLKKKGKDLSQDELHAVNSLIFENSISPNFIRKLVRKYGDESIRAAFFLRDSIGGHYFLDYLLRQNKGYYFRNRYPSITFVDMDKTNKVRL